MAELQVDDLYRRYARSGDLTALTAVFDAIAPDLRRLARRLVRDRAQADDLVQETFLTALEHPESYDPERALTPWLIGILVNRARGERRRAQRELDSERLRRDEAPEPVEEIAASESRSLIERAIAELPPRLRAVVEGKVLHGRESLDLAAELDLSRGALRARLSRGLRRLRRALPASLATGVALWFTRSHGLAQVRARVLEEAAKLPAGASGMGGVVMYKKVVLTSLVVLVAVIGGGIWSAGLLGGERDEALTGAELEPADERAEQVVSRPEAPEPAHREELVLEPVGDEAGLVVRVIEESEVAPVGGLDVRLSYEQDGEQTERTVVTDDEGEARFEFDETVELRVVYADPGERTTPARSWLRRSLPSGERMELELVVNEGGTLAGVVLDQDDVPVPNAEVLGWHRYFDEPCQRTRSGPDGAFTLKHLGTNFYVTARTPRLACQWGVRGDLAAGATAEGLEIRLAPAESLHGVVLAPDLAPIAGAELSVSHALGTSSSHLLTDVPGILRFHAGESGAVSDGQGRFELVGLPRGRHGVRAERAPYLAYREYHETGAQPAEIVLDPGLQLSGRVFDTRGLPAVGARVRFWPCYSNVHTVECFELCDESGRFTLPSLVRDGNHAIGIRHEGHALLVVQPVVPGPGGGEFVEVQLDPEEVIAGRVVDVEGIPVEGAKVWIEGEREVDLGYTSGRRHTWEHALGLDTQRTDEDGAFHFGNLYPGRFTVHLHPPDDASLELSLEVRASTRDLELVLDPQGMRKVTFSGTVTDAITGEALERFEIVPRGEDGWGRIHEFSDPEGRYEVTGISPGEIVIEAQAEGYAPLGVESRRYEVGEHRVDFALYPTRTLILSVIDSAGEVHSRGQVEVLGSDGRPCSMKTGPSSRSSQGQIEQGRAVLHELPAQPLVVRVTVEETVREIDIDLTHPLEGELEVVVDPAIRSLGYLEMYVLVVGQEVDEEELHRCFQGIEEANNRAWLEERLHSGAVAFAETRIEIEIVDGSDRRRGHVVLTPKAEGGYRQVSKTWRGSQQTHSTSEPPLPTFYLTLPAGALTLRARVEGYPDLELSLELRKDEHRRQALVLRRR